MTNTTTRETAVPATEAPAASEIDLEAGPIVASSGSDASDSEKRADGGVETGKAPKALETMVIPKNNLAIVFSG